MVHAILSRKLNVQCTEINILEKENVSVVPLF